MRSPVILSNAPPRLFDSESSKFAIFGLFTIHNPQKTILFLPPSDPPHAHPPGNGKGGPARPRQTKRQPLSARPERDVSYSCILSFARTSMRYRFPNKSSTSMRTDISDGLCLTTQMQEPELPFRNMGQQ